jgi:hypothetical protein
MAPPSSFATTSGSGRGGGTKRKKAASTTASADFKRRRKAKVGKRATRALNDTDVSFQAASLHVAGQQLQLQQPTAQHSSSTTSTLMMLSSLSSSRGRTLDDLLSTLFHPAAPVRQSSLRGLVDIISGQQQQQQQQQRAAHSRSLHHHHHQASMLLLLPHLSVLLPSILHALVDEDDGVRQLSIDAMASLLSGITTTTTTAATAATTKGSPSSLLSSSSSSSLLPFAPLIGARISSALHSLDADTRMSGVQMAKLVAMMAPQVLQQVDEKLLLLPPYVGLLGSGGDAKTTTQSSSSSSSSLDTILQSLVALLRVPFKVQQQQQQQQSLSSSSSTITTTICETVDLVYVPGGRSRNAIMMPSRPIRSPRTLQPITSLSQLPCLITQRQDKSVAAPLLKNKSNDTSTSSVTSALLSKVLDALVDAVTAAQHGGSTTTSAAAQAATNKKKKKKKNNIKKNKKNHDSGSSSSNNAKAVAIPSSNQTWNVPRITLLLRTMGCLHDYHHYQQQQQQHQLPKKQQQYPTTTSTSDFDKIQHKAMKLIMDLFPVEEEEEDNNNNHSSGSGQDINMAMATLLLDVSAAATMKQNDSNHHAAATTTAATAWMDLVLDWVIHKIEGTSQDFGGEEGDKTSPPMLDTASWLDVACKLLKRLCEVHHQEESQHLVTLLDLLYQKIFEQQNAAMICSTAARKIFVLVAELWASNHEEDFGHGSSNTQAKYFHLATFCLESWGTDFLYESQHVLEALLSVVRRTEELDGHSINMMDALRQGMTKLTQPAGNSTFEKYPRHLQHLYLGLLVMLKKPTEASLKNLASICARASVDGINKQPSGLIVESIHSVRKTIPMPVYVGFLINTTAVPQHAKAVKVLFESIKDTKTDNNALTSAETKVKSMDCSLKQVTKLLQCLGPPPHKVFEMIQPQLLAWEKTANVRRDLAYWEYLVRMRPVFVLKAFFFLLTKPHDSSLSMLLNDSESLHLEQSILQYLHCIASKDVAMEMPCLLSPIVALAMAVPSMLLAIFQKVAVWFEDATLSRAFQGNILSILSVLIQDGRMKNDLRDKQKSTLLQEYTQNIAQSPGIVENEPAKQLVSELATNLQVFVL